MGAPATVADPLLVEEKRTERLASDAHIIMGMVFLALSAALTRESPRRSLIAMFLSSGLVLLYGAAMSVILRGKFYRWWNKYLSVSVDCLVLTLVLWAIGSYRTFKSESFLLYFVLIALACLRFSVELVLYSGLLSTACFLSLAVYGVLSGEIVLGSMQESFVSDKVSLTNIILRLVFLTGFFVLLTLVARGYHRIIQQSVENERTAQRLRREKDAIKDTLCRFVAQQVAEKVLAEGVSMSGERKLATILFSDIRGFTHFTETMDPSDVVGFLNNYFSRMVDIIFEYGGTLDKFIGDAIMAVYGAPLGNPDDAERAVRTAVRMRDCLEEMNAGRITQGLPTISVGIGIHTGEVVAGNIGSLRRMDYTVVGSSVNLASRIEGLTKRLRTDILISQDTYTRVRDIVEVERQEPERLRGLAQPYVTYRVVRLRPSAGGVL